MPKKRKGKAKSRSKPSTNGQDVFGSGHNNTPSGDLSDSLGGSLNSADEHDHSCTGTERIPQELMFSSDKNLYVGYVMPLDAQPQRTGSICDDNVDLVCADAGINGFNFVCYPVAGVSRASQYSSADFQSGDEQGSSKKHVADLPPVHVNLSDIQMGKSRCTNYINGFTSPWIDCDNPNTEFAKYSIKQLDTCELPNAEYLGMRSVLIEIRRRDNPNLIRILRKWLWQRETHLSFWIIYPSTITQIEGAQPEDDIWSLWSNFRGKLFNYSHERLVVGIKFLAQIDEEFTEMPLCKRWLGEPLDLFLYDISVLDNFDDLNEYSMQEMSRPYLRFFNVNFHSYNQRCMVANAPGKPSSIKNCTRLLEAIRIAMGKILANTDSLVSLVPSLDEIGVPFEDQFQLPLRPAEDNLSCAVYHTFEKQVDKYVAYRNAIFEAVTDLYDAGVCASSNPPVVFVVGAGRGGLIERVFEAEQQLLEIRTASKPKQWTILAIEKNPFAALSLETSNRQRYNSRVRIIKADARDLKTLQALIKVKADLIVSEMLGSFGCNELEPEVLQFIEQLFCHEKTIMIPQCYASYIEPLHSLKMLQTVKARQPNYYEQLYRKKARDPNSKDNCPTDRLYVVPLNRFHRIVNDLKEIKKCFTFVHPATDQKFKQSAELSFDIGVNCDISGFAGYFDVVLYKNHRFCTIPGLQKSASLSWYPVYIPLRDAIRCPANSSVSLSISRCTDDQGVWYEWNIAVKLNENLLYTSDVQNKDGLYDYILLPKSSSEDEEYDEKPFEIFKKTQ